MGRNPQARETLRFGLIDGDPNLLFDQVRALALDRDGSFWVADSHEAVRHYSSGGDYLGAVGGYGSGPGESPDGYGEVMTGDSTVYVLAYKPELQLFHRDGRYLGSRPPRTQSHPFIFPLGEVDDGWLFRAVDLPTVAEPGAREQWTILRGSPTEPGDESIMTLAGRPRVAGTGAGHWASGSFFDGFPSIAFGGAGRIFYSHPSAYRVDMYSASGNLLASIRRSIERRPYDPGLEAEIERAVRSALRELRTEYREAELQRIVTAALPDDSPQWIPAIDRVLAGADGSLWVRRADAHPRPAERATAAAFGYAEYAWLEAWKADPEFDVFSSKGTYRGTVTLPLDFVPMAVAGDQVYGTLRDDLDVEYIAGFAASPPP